MGLADKLRDLRPFIELLSIVPIERGLPRNPTRGPDRHEAPPEYQNPTPIIAEEKAPTLTNEEILTYQNREIGKELWLLERHLAQGCRISGKPCDCCQKHTFLEALAQETIPIASRIGQPIDPYEKLISWVNQNKHKFTEDAVGSGLYDSEYAVLAGQASLLRKEITGSEAVGALLSNSEREAVKGRVMERITQHIEGEDG